MSFKYYAFGLNIGSTIELEELLANSSDSELDVSILAGAVPHELKKPIYSGLGFEINTNELILNIDNIGRFYVKDGNSITFKMHPKATLRDIKVFILGSCFGAILHQRNILPIHSSTILHEGEAVLFCGISGAGKSSIANSFRIQDFKMLSDDISPVKFIDDIAHAIPAYPQSKLYENSLHSLNIDPTGLRFIRNNVHKRALRYPESFHNQSAPIKAIYYLQVSHIDELKMIELTATSKFAILDQMTYRKIFVEKMNKLQTHFTNLTKLSNSVKVYKILRPHDNKIKDTVDLISSSLN